jgi:hypothetical protein
MLLKQNLKSTLHHHLYLIYLGQFLNILTQTSVIALIIRDYFDYGQGLTKLLEILPLGGSAWTLLLIAIFDLQTLSIYSILDVSCNKYLLPVFQFLIVIAFLPVFFTVILSNFAEELQNSSLVLAGPILIRCFAGFVILLDLMVRLYILDLLSKVPRKKAIRMERAIIISGLSFVLDAIGLTLLFFPRNENDVVYHAVTGMTVAIVGLHFSLLKLHFMEIGIVAFSGSKSEKRAKQVFSDSASIHSKMSVFSFKKSRITVKDLPQRSNENHADEIRAIKKATLDEI